MSLTPFPRRSLKRSLKRISFLTADDDPALFSSEPSRVSGVERWRSVKDADAPEPSPVLSILCRDEDREEREVPPAARSVLRLLNLMTVDLLVSPFQTFREVGEFHTVLTALPTVRAAHLRRLQHGTVELRVECQSSTDLLESLANAYPVPFTIAVHGSVVEIVLNRAYNTSASVYNP